MRRCKEIDQGFQKRPFGGQAEVRVNRYWGLKIWIMQIWSCPGHKSDLRFSCHTIRQTKHTTNLIFRLLRFGFIGKFVVVRAGRVGKESVKIMPEVNFLKFPTWEGSVFYPFLFSYTYAPLYISMPPDCMHSRKIYYLILMLLPAL